MKKRLLVLPLAAMLLAGCGESPNPNPEPKPGSDPVIVDKTLTSIEVTTQPTKVDYKEGETFDTSGMVVSAIYDNGTKEVITNYQVPDQALVPGTTSIDIIYQGKKATVAITVTAIARYTITFMKNATEKIKDVVYKEGEQPSCSYSVQSTAEYTYKMLGWSLTPNGEVLDSLPVASKDATYYAVVQATKNKYTIDFELNCDAEEVDITAEYGTIYDNFDDVIPENEGFKFAGWYFDAQFQTAVSFPLTLTKDVTLYAKWSEKIDIAKYLKLLLELKNFSPYSFIPETMRPDYEDNFIQESDVLDYKTTQSVSNINTNGFGEQWQMILNNIKESQRFYLVLAGADNIFTNAIGALVTHFTENPDSESGKKTTETFEASASFKDGVMSVGVEFKKDISIPLIGSLKPVVKMSYEVKTAKKNISISLNQNNRLKCEYGKDDYTFGISYGIEIAGKEGIRTAICFLNKDDEDCYEGHIFEYFSYVNDEKTKTIIQSSADFYADNMYCSVIGNKASGLIGSEAMINELYDVETGHLYGYMVEENITKTFPIIGELSTIYHTFWFNLKDINNILNVKAVPNGEIDPSKNHHDVYLNNSTSVFEPVHNKKLGVSTSRHNDIEMRDHYYYGLDSQDEITLYETQIPMLFVQDDDKYYMDEKDAKNQNFSDFSADMSKSGVNNASVKVGTKIVEKIREDCIELGPTYKENKELFTNEKILEWLDEE